MLPHQKNKVDVSERKYFDSGDYALSKAGKASDVGVTNIGSQHPLPENIPHHAATGTPTGSGSSNSPIKESSLLHAKSPMGSQQPIQAEDATPSDVTPAAAPPTSD
ncbi:hypothetical protein Q9L58_009352 [Maublancomyces gigas]|uniref:mRNA stability protein n=1 Tax=Discina gigas TaxID=1032678 RepID=A0ABR3G746_9PEZI